MSVSIVDAIRDGFDRTLSPNGLVLVFVAYVLLALGILFTPQQTDPRGGIEDPLLTPPILGETVGAAFFTVVFAIVFAYVAIISYRTFVTDETESIPRQAVRERPIWALVNLIVGWIFFAVLVALGFVLLIVPGLFLLVALWFFDVYVAVEDDDFITALGKSWSLTAGSRIALFALGVLVVIITLSIGAAFGVPQALIGGVLGVLVGALGTAFTTIFTYATTVSAFRQLRTHQEEFTG